MRNVEKIYSPLAPHYVGDGFRVHNFIPKQSGLSMQRMDTFIMMDYNSKYYFPPTDKPRGVSVHPHRGFETVTIAYSGKIQHHDSSGGGGTISEGGVQWMTAGAGILHKEYHEKEFSQQGGDFQMVQLWVNLPQEHKMTAPKYQGFDQQDLAQFKGKDYTVEVIAGKYQSVEGSASTFSELNLLNAKLEEGAETEFSFPNNNNTALLVVEGSILVNNKDKAPENHFVLMENNAETFTIKANQKSKVLVLSGAPLKEPIATYGPFVMNTQKELMEAVDDFNNGKFGYLDE